MESLKSIEGLGKPKVRACSECRRRSQRLGGKSKGKGDYEVNQDEYEESALLLNESDHDDEVGA